MSRDAADLDARFAWMRARQAQHKPHLRRRERGSEIPHGTRYSYLKTRCRCDYCRRANSQYFMAYNRYYVRRMPWPDLFFKSKNNP